MDNTPAAETPTSPTPTPGARARAIFRAAQEAKPFDPRDVGFALEEDSPPGDAREASAAAPHRRRSGAMHAGQWIVLGVMLVVELLVLGGFGYLILTAGH